ncbi:uncharacterized protein LOC132571936 [Heteronotia binoei]|uniref:uncharacterized protein LOC132571936 n=1 Tax=Heteronotia binoei TaxID=13085 RepID=UPI00292FF378|nr:uncharacterized protein LOC132571936 [Heteronotia binoei]
MVGWGRPVLSPLFVMIGCLSLRFCRVLVHGRYFLSTCFPPSMGAFGSSAADIREGANFGGLQNLFLNSAQAVRERAMAARSLAEEFRMETTCSVCLEYFKEPVTIECGHNFCQACIPQCWAMADTGASCPQCREIFQQKNFRPNWQLANLVELARKLQAGKGVEGERRGCKRHQEPLKLFCFDDQAPICVVCDRSMGHQNHRVLPMEEAFVEYKKEIQTELQTLEQERRKLKHLKTADDQRSQKFWTKLQAEKMKIKSAFQQFYSYLEKKERLRLSLLEKMEKEMTKRDKETHTRFLEEVSHLNHLITEMVEKFQQSENEFLQDPKTILSRYVKEPERQLLKPPVELEEALRTYSQKTPALQKALADAQRLLKFAVDEALYKVNVTLDRKTAHPQLIVSLDMKRVEVYEVRGSIRRKFPDSPERFDTLQSVLGLEKFTSGRHCWEVEVGNRQGGWAVGVARESVKRKGNVTLNPDEGFWIVQTECFYALHMSALTSSQSVTLSARIPQKIRVTLDYEEGCVEFFCAETKQRLFAFPSTSFSGEALRPYFFLQQKASLKYYQFPCEANYQTSIFGLEEKERERDMAAGSLVKEFCEETTCSICLEYFKEPVTIECGHNFCQACLAQCWAESDTGASCPQCREIFQQKNFRQNWQLANLVGLVKKLQMGKGVEGERGGCKTHQEPLKLFCIDDQAPICLVCDRSMGHQNHRVLPLEEAFLEYKKEIQTELQSLEQERRKLKKQKMADDRRSRKFLIQLAAEKQRTKSAFQQLHNYLGREEHLRLSLLEEMEKEMAKRDKENHTRFLQEVSHLSRLIIEMKEKFEQSENEFLQDPKTILSRYVKEPERQLLEPPVELEEALRTYSQKTPILQQALAKSQESLECTLDEVLHKVNVTLDPKTAHPQLIVSSDMKSVRWGRQTLPDNPGRFDTLQSVLGREKFTSGRHCWEVEVGNGQGEWAVGIARESVKRKGSVTLNPDEGFWIVKTECFYRHNFLWRMSALTSPQSVTLSASIPQKIQVSLDYEEGCVEFFSAETKQRLFAFPSASFSGEALRPFFLLSSLVSFKCCS